MIVYLYALFSSQLGLSPLFFCGSKAVEKENKSKASPPPVTVDVLKKAPADLPSPRLCVLQKGSLGFGFNLSCVPQTIGTFISHVRQSHYLCSATGLLKVLYVFLIFNIALNGNDKSVTIKH